MKRILLAGAALAAMTTASFAADPVYEEVDVWSGYFVGLHVGGMSGKASLDFQSLAGAPGQDVEEVFDHGIAGGVFYGRNWQSGNWVFGLDSSFTYLGWDEELDVAVDGRPTGDIEAIDIEANFLGASRLKVGYAFDSVLLFIAGGLATTRFEADITTAGPTTVNDDDWAFGWTIGAGIEAKIAENWSARIEALYAEIESDDLDGPPDSAVDADLELTIVRVGVGYHF